MSFDYEGVFKGTEECPVGIFRQNRYLPEMHHHLEYELFYLSAGTATIKIHQTEFKIKKNDVFMIPPGIEHCVVSHDEEFEYYAIIFDSTIFGAPNDTTRKIFESIIIDQKLLLTNDLLQKIRYTNLSYERNNFGKEIAVKNLVYDIFQHVVETKQYAPLPQLSPDTHNKKTIDNALTYIQEHFNENITLDDLLASTHYSKSHFIRLFKTNTGMNYTDYLNRYRVEKACRDLIYSIKNVTEIATENGFNNIQYFSKIFKRYMDCTPKQYQKKWRV